MKYIEIDKSLNDIRAAVWIERKHQLPTGLLILDSNTYDKTEQCVWQYLRLRTVRVPYLMMNLNQ